MEDPHVNFENHITKFHEDPLSFIPLLASK